MSVAAYKKQSLMSGWTRVDLLLYLYDRAITSLQACQEAREADDSMAYSEHFIQMNKMLIAIHAGLKPDDEVAFNVARLLHFVSQCIEKDDFPTAINILQSLHDGFAAVADEANELETSGKIPSIPFGNAFRV